MLEVIIPSNRNTIIKQIKALEWQIKRDNQKDKQIHLQVLNELKRALK